MIGFLKWRNNGETPAPKPASERSYAALRSRSIRVSWSICACGVIARLYIGLGPIRGRARIDQDDPVRQSRHGDRQKGRGGYACNGRFHGVFLSSNLKTSFGGVLGQGRA